MLDLVTTKACVTGINGKLWRIFHKAAHFFVFFLSVNYPLSVDFLIPALQSLWGQGDYKQEMDEMLAEQAIIEAAKPKNPLRLLTDGTIRWQLITMFLIYTCNMLSGMPAVRMQLILALD